MIQKRVEVIIQEIADKYNKPYYVIEEVFLSQFRIVKSNISSLEFKTIKLPSFGKFIASNKKTIEFKEYLNRMYDLYGAKNNQSNALQGQKQRNIGGEENKDISV